jgi:hypothetical protein
MNSWEYLPGEILDFVFDIIANDLDRSKDLCQCQLTCKDWSEHAQMRLYEKIHILDHKMFLKLLASLCSTDYKPASFVKCISIWFPEELLYLLLLRCPNIEVIEGIFERNGGILEALQEACERGTCKHLQRITRPLYVSSEFDQQMYVNVMYSLRASLRDLFMCENSMVPSNITSRSLLQNLNEFPTLHSLTIETKSMELFYQIGKYIACCKNLGRLELGGYCYKDTIDDKLPDVHPLVICPTIKYLRLNDVHVTKKMLEYIMHTFPNLDNFFIGIDPDNRCRDDTIPNILWLQFLIFVRNMKGNTDVSVNITDIPGVLVDYFYLKRSDAHLRITYDSTIAQPFVCIENNKGRTENRYLPIEVCISSEYDRTQLTYVGLLYRLGSFLKSLAYVGECIDGREFGDSSFLDFFCEQCPSLEKFECSNMIFYDCNTTQVQTNSSIKEVTVSNCSIPNELFTEFSVRFPSLSILRIKFCDRVNSDGTPLQGYHNLVIEMPNISFDTLSCIWSGNFCKFNNINLRIDTSKKSHYYFANQDNGLIESSSTSFQKLWNDKTVFSWRIHCQEIQNLSFAFKRFPWDIKLNVVHSK